MGATLPTVKRDAAAQTTKKSKKQQPVARCGNVPEDIEDVHLRSGMQPVRGREPVTSQDEAWLQRLQECKDVEPLYEFADLRAVHLELTTQCNAACPQCARSDRGGPPNPLLAQSHAELSLADIKMMLPPQVLQQLKKVYLCGNYGDPAVARDCLEVLQYFREERPGLKAGLFTNGGVRSPSWWAQLGRIMQPRGKAFVRFAIDGDKDTNALYRQNVVWERLMDNVKAFIGAGGVAEWDFIVFEHNEHIVEKMRELSQELGFVKFNAKRTARFLNRKQGGMLEHTPVKDAAGNVVRHLKPPRNREWQNEAVVADVQRAIQSYGSIDAYYDQTEVSCKVAQEREVYISAQGLAFPCCWLAGELYNMNDKDRQFARLLSTLDPVNGIFGQSVKMQPGDLRAVIDRKGGLFAQLVPAAMRQRSVSCGRLRTCSITCGKEVPAFKKQFDAAAVEFVRREIQPGSAAAEDTSTVTVPATAHVQIWYGSQTGNSEQLAHRAAATLTAALNAPVLVVGVSAGLHRRSGALANAAAILLITSTWGDGEPTDDAIDLFEWLAERSRCNMEAPASLPPVAVFGLGSSFWPKYNAAAKRAEKLLRSCGSKFLATLGEGDAAALGGHTASFDDWFHTEVVPAIASLQQSQPGLRITEAKPPAVTVHSCSTLQRADAVQLRVTACRRLAPADEGAVYCEVEIQLGGAFTYGAADAIGILPPAATSTGAHATDGSWPRWYTTSSSPRSGDDMLRITVREVSGGRCSPWLCTLKSGDLVECLAPRRRSAIAAAVAQRPSAPVVAVAAGAGVAPFIALLEERSLGSSVAAPWLLFMGCRRGGDSLPHKSKLDSYVASGVLEEVVLAESRSLHLPRQLVQDVVKAEAAAATGRLCRLLFPPPSESGAVVLVCGSAQMGASIRQVVSQAAGRAGVSIEDMERSGRYVAELW